MRKRCEREKRESGKGRNGRHGAHLQVVLIGGGSSGGAAELAGERGEAEEIPWCLRRPGVEASKGKELLAWGSEEGRAAGREAAGAGLQERWRLGLDSRWLGRWQWRLRIGRRRKTRKVVGEIGSGGDPEEMPESGGSGCGIGMDGTARF